MAHWQAGAEWRWLAATIPGKFKHAGIILHISVVSTPWVEGWNILITISPLLKYYILILIASPICEVNFTTVTVWMAPLEVIGTLGKPEAPKGEGGRLTVSLSPSLTLFVGMWHSFFTPSLDLSNHRSRGEHVQVVRVRPADSVSEVGRPAEWRMVLQGVYLSKRTCTSK